MGDQITVREWCAQNGVSISYVPTKTYLGGDFTRRHYQVAVAVNGVFLYHIDYSPSPLHSVDDAVYRDVMGYLAYFSQHYWRGEWDDLDDPDYGDSIQKCKALYEALSDDAKVEFINGYIGDDV